MCEIEKKVKSGFSLEKQMLFRGKPAGRPVGGL
jgi:hypothetical protein